MKFEKTTATATGTATRRQRAIARHIARHMKAGRYARAFRLGRRIGLATGEGWEALPGGGTWNPSLIGVKYPNQRRGFSLLTGREFTPMIKEVLFVEVY